MAGAEIINLKAICGLPKGTEYFFSDLHGEYESFGHLLRSSSGIIRAKIGETFGNLMTEADQLALANLIYYPERILSEKRHKHEITDEWIKVTINKLTEICRVVSSKYTRSKVRKKMPSDYGYAIDELLHLDQNDFNKKQYYQEILNAIVEIGGGEDFIIALCKLIRNLTIDSLHIIGDIFDRRNHRYSFAYPSRSRRRLQEHGGIAEASGNGLQPGRARHHCHTALFQEP